MVGPSYPSTSAISLSDVGVIFQNVAFRNHVTVNSGAAISIQTTAPSVLTYFQRCEFTNCVAGSNGGSVVVSGSGVLRFDPGSARVWFQDCTFHKSAATTGGAIALVNGAAAQISRTYFYDACALTGGAIAISNSRLLMTDSKIVATFPCDFVRFTGSGRLPFGLRGGAMSIAGISAVVLYTTNFTGQIAQQVLTFAADLWCRFVCSSHRFVVPSVTCLCVVYP